MAWDLVEVLVQLEAAAISQRVRRRLQWMVAMAEAMPEPRPIGHEWPGVLAEAEMAKSLLGASNLGEGVRRGG